MVSTTAATSATGNNSSVSRPRVYVRIRPLNENERVEGKGEWACRRDATQPGVLYLRKDDKSSNNNNNSSGGGGEELQARFDHIFDSNDGQRVVYEHIGPEVQRALFSGYNASIFAYGQTGSGKTYTMEGVLDRHKHNNNNHHNNSNNNNDDDDEDSDEGLVPRLLRGIFATFARDATRTNAMVHMSLVQIYNERIQDLLSACRPLELHMDSTGQYVARDATWCRVDGVHACMRRYREACSLRATSATELNLVSSRSHMILMLRLQWDAPALPGSRAQLNLVDLAGSERLGESGATGGVMAEAIHINKSLSALGNVVMRLVEQAKRPHRRLHVPYKDSKLTYLLQSSLGGANVMHFILAVSGSALWRSETASTIAFGKRALQLVLRPVRNAIDFTRLAEMEAMIERMRSHIANLEEELRDARHGSTTQPQAPPTQQTQTTQQQQRHDDDDTPTHVAEHGNGDDSAAAFLRLRRLRQDDDDDDDDDSGDASARRRRRRRDGGGGSHSRHARHLKRQTELMRILANLPETFDDLTSHCLLFPASRQTFRELGGLPRLVHFVQRAASTYYRAHAAQALASVLDDAGRDELRACGGLDALTRLLHVDDERCKEAACVALEVACRGCARNKAALSADVYATLATLLDGYGNQQVQEAACAAVATLVDGFAAATRALEAHDVAARLLRTLRTCPVEVVDVAKAATNCLGRLAHGDVAMQTRIGDGGGVTTLIDDVLFGARGARDHQLPILASYALVNVCCSHAGNLARARAHARYGEVKLRLLEGLARAFGSHAARAGYGHAVAHERDAHSPFTYHGVSVCGAWTAATAGGRPVLASFLDNPQLHLRVGGDNSNNSNNNDDNDGDMTAASSAGNVDVALVIQDTQYEARLRRKRRGHAVYMGLAIFDGDANLAAAELKLLDFHGRMLYMSGYTSNCENVLHCSLPPRRDGASYVVVPFTSQRGRTTRFVLSAFADAPVQLTAVRDDAGWRQTTLRGRWSDWSGRGGEGAAWRCNPQLRVRARDACRLVFVLSYATTASPAGSGKRATGATAAAIEGHDDESDDNDDDVASMLENSDSVVTPRRRRRPCNHDADNDNDNDNDNEDSAGEQRRRGGRARPRLHGRLFRSDFAPDKRYVKALVPLPQGSSFVASNTFASSSYVTTSATLPCGGGGVFVFVPFTEQPCAADYVVTVYSDSDDVDVAPLRDEWHATALRAAWQRRALTLRVTTTTRQRGVSSGGGRMVVVAHSAQTFLRVRVRDAQQPAERTLAAMASYWNSEAIVEVDCNNSSGDGDDDVLLVHVEGVVRANKVTTTGNNNGNNNSSIVTTRGQEVAHAGVCDVIVFSECACDVQAVDFDALPCPLPYPSTTTPPPLLQYAQCVRDDDDSDDDDDDDDDDACDDDSDASLSRTSDGSCHDDDNVDHDTSRRRTRRVMRRVAAENAQLRRTVAEQAAALAQLRRSDANDTTATTATTTTTAVHDDTAGNDVAPAARRVSRAAASRHNNNNSNNSSTTALPHVASRAQRDNNNGSSTALRSSTTTNAAATTMTSEAAELRTSIDYALLRLHAMMQQPDDDDAGSASRLRQDIQALQHHLFRTLERCDASSLSSSSTTAALPRVSNNNSKKRNGSHVSKSATRNRNGSSSSATSAR